MDFNYIKHGHCYIKKRKLYRTVKANSRQFDRLGFNGLSV